MRLANRIARIAGWIAIVAAVGFWIAIAKADEPEPLCYESDLPVSEWDADAFEQTPEDAALEALDDSLDALGWEWIDGVPGEAFHAYLIEKAYTRDETRIEVQRLMDEDFAQAFERSGR